MQNKEIIYVSTLSSKRILNNVFEQEGWAPFAVQKFSRLIVTGIAKGGNKITALSSPVCTKHSKKWINETTETEDEVKYKYTPFLNVVGIKHIMIIIYSFFYILFWGLSNRQNKVIICDVLHISICMGALLASKIIRVNSVGVVTDMPGLMVGNDQGITKHSLGQKLVQSINKSYLSHFSSYIFLTEQMNEPINTRHRPYIIMEGLVDANIAKDMAENNEKANPRTLIYAGGLYARYGLKTLCEAFTRLPNQDVCLKLYGSGTFVKDLEEDYCKRDKRIIYMGIRPNEEVVREELCATLLINPRPTTEEFTKYSFPSKNMEYMVSGTPLLTTKLPGMPADYYPFIYLFEDESVEGYAATLSQILNLPAKELKEKGRLGKDFVLLEKNNLIQAKRILQLIYDISK